jgi:hypothetical protein
MQEDCFSAGSVHHRPAALIVQNPRRRLWRLRALVSSHRLHQFPMRPGNDRNFALYLTPYYPPPLFRSCHFTSQ